ncbi:RHS repeat-associated core domain-containing protein [Trinickia sp. NRRL B-1857]
MFQGQQEDSETGLHYNRYRYYDPAIGRFVSMDPIKLAGGLNLYRYGPNPVQWTDALGLSSGRCPGKAIVRQSRSEYGPHFDVEVVSNAGGRTMRTHQLITDDNNNTIITGRELAPESTVENTVLVDLPDAEAAKQAQAQRLGHDGGVYDKNTNSCVTHVGDILRAGGAPDVPNTTRETIKWLIKNGQRK